MVDVVRHPNAVLFLELAEPTLLRQELANNLILGVPYRLREHPQDDKPENLYLTAADGGNLLGAAVMTPPYNVIVHVEEEASDRSAILDALADAVLSTGAHLPGVVGRTPTVEEFANLLSEKSGRPTQLETAERLFQLREVIWPPKAPGYLRQGILADFPAAERMFGEFVAEALSPGEQAMVTDRTRAALEEGRLYFWVVEEAHGEELVCMVGASRALANGRTIGPVYTPPAERGKGYASNATAALSALLLEQGYAFTTLFTNLANPTSNKIYRQIGYEPVCDYAVWRLDEPRQDDRT